MYVLGHLGIGLGLAWLLTYRRPASIDYRLVLLGAILPDLIDKPLGALLGLEARLWAHGLIVLLAILAASRVPGLRGLQWVGFGVATHLLLDQIWNQPNVVLWPFAGPFVAQTTSLGGYIHVLFTDPYVQFGEVTGALILVALAWRYGLLSRSGLKAFLGTGHLEHAPTAA